MKMRCVSGFEEEVSKIKWSQRRKWIGADILPLEDKMKKTKEDSYINSAVKTDAFVRIL